MVDTICKYHYIYRLYFMLNVLFSMFHGISIRQLTLVQTPFVSRVGTGELLRK